MALFSSILSFAAFFFSLLQLVFLSHYLSLCSFHSRRSTFSLVFRLCSHHDVLPTIRFLHTRTPFLTLALSFSISFSHITHARTHARMTAHSIIVSRNPLYTDTHTHTHTTLLIHILTLHAHHILHYYYHPPTRFQYFSCSLPCMFPTFPRLFLPFFFCLLPLSSVVYDFLLRYPIMVFFCAISFSFLGTP